MEPGNARYWAKLGAFERWDLEHRDLKQAVEDYEMAVKVNPRSGRYWTELAGVYEEAGNTQSARAAHERAQAAHPISSDVAWQYGNFLLRQGEAEEACAQFHRAVLVDPELTESAVGECWQARGNASTVLAQLLPPQAGYYFKALDYFCRRGDMDGGLQAWGELLKLEPRLELPQAVPFVNDLISAGRAGDARRVWSEALGKSHWPMDTEDGSSVLFNGGFEHEPVNGGLDWREDAMAGASMALDDRVAHSGSRSLQISFDGRSNLDFQNVVQYAAVEPERRYRFSAYLRSAQLSTDSGMRFELADPFRHDSTQIMTAGVTGTQPWTKVETEIVTGRDTRLLRIVLRRTPSSKLDNKLRGTVWVDDVSLVLLAGGNDGGRR